jgi:hypothetical protein
MMVPMSDALGLCQAVTLVTMFVTVLLYGHARPGEKHALRYLYASYAAFGSIAVSLALLGSVRQGVLAVIVLAVTLPIIIVRDKRRWSRKT